MDQAIRQVSLSGPSGYGVTRTTDRRTDEAWVR